MRKIMVIVLVSILFLSVFTVFSIEICKAADGEVLYVRGPPGSKPWFLDIQPAIDAASDADTIYVYNGTYYENVVINKTISLIGMDKNTTIIDGNGSGSVIQLHANYVNITGFTIKNSGNMQGAAGMHIFSNYTNISGNIILNNNIGVYLYYSSNNVLISNTITTSGQGIHLWESSNNIITGNTIIGFNYSDSGIYLFGSSNNVISENTITNTTWGGIRIAAEAHNNHISKNTLTDNNIGITISSGSHNNYIYDDNIFSNNNQDIADESKTPSSELILLVLVSIIIVAIVTVLFLKRKRIN